MLDGDLTGRKLGEVKLLQLLGKGGMGEVYLGRHLTLDINVAVKVLPSDLSKDRNFLERFYREAQQAAKLDHPNIVRILNVAEASSIHYMTMQYINGPTLQNIISKTTLPLAKAVSYIIQALQGISYAHQHSVIHRDIKPDNLMLTEDGWLKITDFGLARNLRAGNQITHSGAIMGTPAYMAPEQWEDAGKIDAQADIYSIGVALFHLLTARFPFEAESPMLLYRRILEDRRHFLRNLNPKIPLELSKIVEKMCAPKKNIRYKTSADTLHDLKNWFKQSKDANKPLIPQLPTKRQSAVPIIKISAHDPSNISGNKPKSEKGAIFSGKKKAGNIPESLQKSGFQGRRKKPPKKKIKEIFKPKKEREYGPAGVPTMDDLQELEQYSMMVDDNAPRNIDQKSEFSSILDEEPGPQPIDDAPILSAKTDLKEEQLKKDLSAAQQKIVEERRLHPKAKKDEIYRPSEKRMDGFAGRRDKSIVKKGFAGRSIKKRVEGIVGFGDEEPLNWSGSGLAGKDA